MQATARMASVVSSALPARRRLIRIVRPTPSAMRDIPDEKATRPRKCIWRWVLIVAALSLIYAGPRLSTTLRFAGRAHVPSLSGDFTRLDILLPPSSSTVSSFHLGLPHNYFASDEFLKSVWFTFTTSHHGYRFRSFAWTPSPRFADLVQRLFTEKSTFTPYGGPKLCGGYHADFAVQLDAPKRAVEFMVCLGCHEVLLFAPSGECIVELSDESYRMFTEAWKHEQH